MTRWRTSSSRKPSWLEDVELTTETYELLARATPSGCSSSTAVRCGRLRPDGPTEFDDISAVGALYRPGPMGANAHNDYADRKNGRQPVTPIHPELAEPLKDILGETYGLIVYQEQVMAIAQKLAGYTLGKADLLRRAMGKKKKETSTWTPLRAGEKDHGSPSRGQDLWDSLPLLRLRFQPRALAAYGVVATAAYLRPLPAEYIAAVPSARRHDKARLPCRVPRMGIRCCP